MQSTSTLVFNLFPNGTRADKLQILSKEMERNSVNWIAQYK